MAVVLIVDDHANTRWVLADLVRRDGHEVLAATNGKEALSVYRSFLPDVVLIDLFMPVHDGFDAIRSLKSEFPNSRVIAISGDWTIGGKSGLRVARELGADLTIRKPFSTDVVRAAVRELLSS